MKSSPIKTRIGGVSSPLRQDTESEQSWLASATDDIRKNLAENLMPMGYRDPFGRIYRAGIKGEKSQARHGMGEYLEGEVGGGHERIDLLNIVMGQPQKYNSMRESEYKPAESKDSKATYYKSERTETEIKESFKAALEEGKSVDEAFAIVKSYRGTGEGRRGGSVLGTYKTDKGVDEKGHYISYYDIWDLNPIPETGVESIDVGVGKVVNYLTKKAGMKSPEIYGRIYYDPKTGEIIE